MVCEWQELSLADAGIQLIDCDHRTPPAANFGFPYVAIPQLKDGRIELDGVRRISSEHYEDWTRKLKPREHDVIVVRRCNSGQSAFVPKGLECAIGQNLVILRSDGKSVYPAYLRWLVRGPDWWSEVQRHINVGAVFDSLKCRDIPNFQIKVPSLEEQLEIAETLGALDDRIDNLRQTNATLQAIAVALFKSWFVDFDGIPQEDMQESELGLIPKGWRAGTLGECCENIRKQARPDALPSGTPYIGLEHMPRKSIALTEWSVSDGLASGKFWYQRNDVLFGKLRPYFHKVGVVSHEGVCSTDILVIRPNKPHWFGFMAMHLFSDTIISYATQLSNGAKMPRTNWSDIAVYKVVLPPDKISAVFNDAIHPLIEKIHASIETATTLGALRDTLLPRLISGKLRIPEATRYIAEVRA